MYAARFSFLTLLAVFPLALSGCSFASGGPAADSESGSQLPFAGKEIAYLTAFYPADDDDLSSLDADLIEWFTGPGAAKAAKADNPGCPGDCQPPNGYYVRNTDKRPLTFDVSNDVRVYLQTRDPFALVPDEEVTYEQFLAVARGDGGRVANRFLVVPFWLTHEDGVITEIREQYVP